VAGPKKGRRYGRGKDRFGDVVSGKGLGTVSRLRGTQGPGRKVKAWRKRKASANPRRFQEEQSGRRFPKKRSGAAMTDGGERDRERAAKAGSRWGGLPIKATKKKKIGELQRPGLKVPREKVFLAPDIRKSGRN